MATILVRFAELGLKSERVRSRFLSQLADDIEESLINAKVEHLMDVKRSRIFIETRDMEGASNVLKHVPGIYSFSFVEVSSSEYGSLMASLSEYGKPRISEGMTYGLKVRRTGEHPYTSQEIAVNGGGAVISHLDESKIKVNLKDPDIWIEVEVRDSRAYLFDNRTKGLGGMPASSQGRVVLFLPDMTVSEHENGEMIDRVVLSYTLMRRRGCKVIPVTSQKGTQDWVDALQGNPMVSGPGPFILEGESIFDGLRSAVMTLKVWGVVIPCRAEDAGEYPIMHSEGAPISQFYPTSALDHDGVREWLRVFRC